VLKYSSNGDILPVKGQPHAGQIVALATPGGGRGDTIYSTGFDDCFKEIAALDASFTFVDSSSESDVFAYAGLLRLEKLDVKSYQSSRNLVVSPLGLQGPSSPLCRIPSSFMKMVI
jgi:hypothetical protein